MLKGSNNWCWEVGSGLLKKEKNDNRDAAALAAAYGVGSGSRKALRTTSPQHLKFAKKEKVIWCCHQQGRIVNRRDENQLRLLASPLYPHSP